MLRAAYFSTRITWEKECHALWCGRMLSFHGLNLFIIFVVAFNLTSISFHSNPVSLFTFRALAFAQQTWRHFCQVLFSPCTLEWPQSMRSWTLPNRSSKLELPSNFYLRAERNPKRVDFREEYIRIPPIFTDLSRWHDFFHHHISNKLGARRSQQGHSHEGRSSPSKEWSATSILLGPK